MSQRLNYVELVPEGIAAMRAVEHYLNTGTGLEPELLELVRLRASLLNGCEYCVGLHAHEARKRNETDGRIADVAGWRESDAYTQRERAAFAWTEAITDIQVGHVPDEVFLAARGHFSEQDLANLTIAIGSINLWNRMTIAFRAEHKPAGKTDDMIEDDGGKVSVDD